MDRVPLKVGITIGLRDAGESLWLNGIKQNALYLAKLLQKSNYRHQVVLLNTTDIAITDRLPWDRNRFATLPFEEGWSGLDVLIELGGQIDWDQTVRVKRQGTKIVSYCCGPEYVQNMEAIIFRRPLYDSLYINRSYDSIWVIPQILDLNRGFFETLRRCPVREVPFVWDPMAIEAATVDLADAGRYRPGSGGKRISIIEPNIDVLKFCLYPIFIVERAFRLNPDLIRYLHVANSEQFVHDNREFAGLMRQLDLAHASRVSFIGRVTTPLFLAEYTDVVVSHQWGLPLNYLYLECCWQGYPLLHNSEHIEDLGYYYPGHDIGRAGDLLADLLRSHDDGWSDYASLQRQRITRFLADDPHLAATYDDLLFELIAGVGG